MSKKINVHTNKTSLFCVAIPPPPPRFSLNEWHLYNRVQNRLSNDQQQLAERIVVENDRLVQKIDEETKAVKEDSNNYINVRIEEVEFRKKETELQRKMACIEIDNLKLYKERVFDAWNAVAKEALTICKKCIILRESRVGIDLVHDDVEKELQKELEVISSSQGMLKRLLEEMEETIRKLRSTIYLLDRDLEGKVNAIKIDKHNINLDEHSLNLSIYHGTKPLDYTTITQEEWEGIVDKNFYSVAQAINSGASLRVYADVILKQIIEDLRAQYCVVNEAFRRRIEETKEAKIKLENQHYEVTRQIMQLNNNITNIEKSIAEKENYMALAHTRLGNRAQRDGWELCMDIAQTKLCTEIRRMIENVAELQQCLNESQATIRYLLKTQIQIEQDINIKTNTLKIDEVECMSIRPSMDYHAY